MRDRTSRRPALAGLAGALAAGLLLLVGLSGSATAQQGNPDRGRDTAPGQVAKAATATPVPPTATPVPGATATPTATGTPPTATATATPEPPQLGEQPGWGCGDANHEHTGPPGNPDAEGPCDGHEGPVAGGEASGDE